MHYALVAVILLALECCAEKGTFTYSNPVVSSNAPDPGVLLLNGTYWMVSTAGDSNTVFPLRSSPNLVEWTSHSPTFQAGSPTWASGSFWAPELHVLSSGKLVLYFTARERISNRLCVSVAVANSDDDPSAGFVDALGGCLVEDELGAIDATFYKENAREYLIWKVDGNSQGKPTPIMIRELDPSGTSFKIGSAATEILRDSLPWEGGPSLVEGPWLVKIDRLYFLFYSGSGYAGTSYAVGVARSTSLQGPYEKACAPILSFYPRSTDDAQTFAFAGPGQSI